MKSLHKEYENNLGFLLKVDLFNNLMAACKQSCILNEQFKKLNNQLILLLFVNNHVFLYTN